MKSTTELFEELFAVRLAALSAEHGLTAAETERILAAFRQATANPFMTDQHLYQKLSGEDTCA